MALALYNTLTRKKEEFRPLKPGTVTMYNCGPTVYDYAHIGNFRSYVFADLLRRFLEWKGLRVKQVMNITDVDDKTIKGAQKAGVPLKEYTMQFEKSFFEDMERLNIKKAHIHPRATEHIPEMVALIQKLLERRAAYKAEDGIYYRISSFFPYGTLARLDVKGLKAGARVAVDEYEKETASDFALWKFWTPLDGPVVWETELGKGRPGWHIECSAMGMKHLGEQIDIHTGGVDLIFPHHQNEIAQSEGVTGKRFVQCWLHNEHLLVNGMKMAKRLKNFHTLRDLLELGYDPVGFRYLMLAAHYREKLNFTFESLRAATETVNSIKEFLWEIRSRNGTVPSSVMDRFRKEFEAALDDDLNTPKALAALHQFISEVKKTAGKDVYKLFMELDDVLGLRLAEAKELWHSINQAPADVRELLLKREAARQKNDFKAADSIRAELKTQGIVLEDIGKGLRWRKG